MSASPVAIHFAQFSVTTQVFYTTRLCAAMVNLKPILPGHSLVIPRRVVPRYADLAADEVSSRKMYLFSCTVNVANVDHRSVHKAPALFLTFR